MIEWTGYDLTLEPEASAVEDRLNATWFERDWAKDRRQAALHDLTWLDDAVERHLEDLANPLC
jgi:hypothetical protein